MQRGQGVEDVGGGLRGEAGAQCAGVEQRPGHRAGPGRSFMSMATAFAWSQRRNRANGLDEEGSALVALVRSAQSCVEALPQLWLLPPVNNVAGDSVTCSDLTIFNS